MSTDHYQRYMARGGFRDRQSYTAAVRHLQDYNRNLRRSGNTREDNIKFLLRFE